LNLICILLFGARCDFPAFERCGPFDPLVIDPEDRVGPRVANLQRQVFRIAKPSEVKPGEGMTQRIHRPRGKPGCFVVGFKAFT